MIASGCGCDVSDRVSTLTNVNGTFEYQRFTGTDCKCPNVPNAGGRIITYAQSTGATVVAGRGKPGRQEVDQRNIGRAVRSVVGNGDLKGDNIALFRVRIAAGKCLDRDKIGSRNYNHNRFIQVIADS